METEADSDLLVNAYSLQTEETTAESWRSLPEVEQTGFRGHCNNIPGLKVAMTTYTYSISNTASQIRMFHCCVCVCSPSLSCSVFRYCGLCRTL